MASNPSAAALEAFDEGLSSRPWLGDPDEHARGFLVAMADALSASLPQVGPQSGVAVAYASARAEAPLAPASYHETWARTGLVLAARDAMRAADADADDGARFGLSRLVPSLVRALDAAVGRETSADRGSPEALLTSAKESLSSSLKIDGTFAFAFGQHARRSMQLLGVKESVPAAALRAAVQRADQAARAQEGPAWVGLPAARRVALARRCAAELAAALVEGLPRALAKAAAEGSREGKAACLHVSRVACLLLLASEQCADFLGLIDDPPPAAPEAAPQVHNNENNGVLSGTDLAPRTKNEQGKNMDSSEKPSLAKHPIVKTLQADAVEAAWRTAGSQFVKLTREPLVGLLSRHLGPDDPALRNKIAAFLQTEMGTAMLSAVLSVGLSAMPPSAGEAPHRLAKELRVKAMADVGDVVAEVLMGPLRTVIAFYLQDVGGAVAASAPAELPAPSTPEIKAPNNVVPIGVSDKEAIG